jgi:hypothetical protein
MGKKNICCFSFFDNSRSENITENGKVLECVVLMCNLRVSFWCWSGGVETHEPRSPSRKRVVYLINLFGCVIWEVVVVLVKVPVVSVFVVIG